jgi:shikimate kinase
LLQTSDPLARARQLYLQRDELYRETADLVINVDHQKSAQVLAFLRDQLGTMASSNIQSDCKSGGSQ